MLHMSKYFLHGSLVAKPNSQKELTQIMIQASKLMKTANGCELYIVSTDPADTQTVWITEIWTTKQDHENSLSATGVRELISKAIPLLDQPPTKGQELTVISN
jgi:quinol monooxygenase YgiN